MPLTTRPTTVIDWRHWEGAQRWAKAVCRWFNSNPLTQRDLDRIQVLLYGRVLVPGSRWSLYRKMATGERMMDIGMMPMVAISDLSALFWRVGEQGEAPPPGIPGPLLWGTHGWLIDGQPITAAMQLDMLLGRLVHGEPRSYNNVRLGLGPLLAFELGGGATATLGAQLEQFLTNCWAKGVETEAVRAVVLGRSFLDHEEWRELSPAIADALNRYHGVTDWTPERLSRKAAECAEYTVFGKVADGMPKRVINLFRQAP
jgi:hypothetical protein